MAKTIKEQIAAITAKIEADTAKLAELNAKLGNEIDESALIKGVVVFFNYGKKPNVIEKLGLIVGRKNAVPGTKEQDWLNVAVGVGFDALTVKVSPTAVTKIGTFEDLPKEVEEPAAAE